MEGYFACKLNRNKRLCVRAPAFIELRARIQHFGRLVPTKRETINKRNQAGATTTTEHQRNKRRQKQTKTNKCFFIFLVSSFLSLLFIGINTTLTSPHCGLAFRVFFFGIVDSWTSRVSLSLSHSSIFYNTPFHPPNKHRHTSVILLLAHIPTAVAPAPTAAAGGGLDGVGRHGGQGGLEEAGRPGGAGGGGSGLVI
jgi:hypothetical protein